MEFLSQLGIKENNYGLSTGLNWGTTEDQGKLNIHSPATGEYIASVYQVSADDFDKMVDKAGEAFKYWRTIPAPRRGEIVRQIGLELREFKQPLGTLVSYEMGKSLQEGLGEVQEMIEVVLAEGWITSFTLHQKLRNLKSWQISKAWEKIDQADIIRRTPLFAQYYVYYNLTWRIKSRRM